MKVVLLAPPIMDYVGGSLIPAEMDAVRVCPPYGLYLLAATLRADGHEVVIGDLIAPGTRDITPFADAIRDCGLVGIAATSLSWATSRDVMEQVRALRPDVPIVLGNVHATLFDTYLLRRFPVDFVIRGEAERALSALCRALELRASVADVPNLSWKDGGRVVRNPVGPQIPEDELARAPVPDYAELPAGVYKGLALESSRGCAVDCSFCSTPYRRSWRGIAPEPFVDRLAAMSEHVGRTTQGVIHIIDDEFSMAPRRAADIARELRRRKMTPRLIYDSRAIDFLKGEFLENIAEFTYLFLIGAECGYPEGLERVGKGVTVEMLEQVAERLAAAGLAGAAEYSFIIGLPWETITEVKRTLAFAAHLYGSYGVKIRLNWYTQMPGSRLWDESRKAELVSEAMYDEYGFYKNLYLFRSGVRLSPSQIWEVRDIVEKLRLVGNAVRPDAPRVDFFFPLSILSYFPREVLGDGASGLSNLRQIARPPARE